MPFDIKSNVAWLFIWNYLKNIFKDIKNNVAWMFICNNLGNIFKWSSK